MNLLSNLINGISLGSVYAIIALGYTMVYGIAKMLNFAHGDVIMVGAYVCLLHHELSVICPRWWRSYGSSGLYRAGYCDRAVWPISPFVRLRRWLCLITAIGVSYFLQNAALLIWKSRSQGASPRS